MDETQRPNCSSTLPKRIPFLEFHHVATIAKYAPVKAQAISDSRFGYASITDGPILQVEFVNPAPGIAPDISRIVPGAVVHYSPAHELSARIVRVPVVVKEIGNCEAAHCNAVPFQRP